MNSMRWSLGTWSVVVMAVGLLVAGCGKAPDPAIQKAAATLFATIETDRGVIEVQLLPGIAPRTVENFRLLADRGTYNGVQVFRIVKNFMIQTGDPQNDGKGGESAWGGAFADEIDKASPVYRGKYLRGTVAMANAGPNTNKSQFFIVQQDFPLSPDYTKFGRVTKGIDVVDAMMDLPMQRGIDGGMTRPVNPPVIRKVTVASRTTPAP